MTLVQAVYKLNGKMSTRPLLDTLNTYCKIVAFIFPALVFSIIQVPAVKAQRLAFILLFDLPCKPYVPPFYPPFLLFYLI